MKRVFKNGNPTSAIIAEKVKLLQQSDSFFGLLLVIDEASIQFGSKNLLQYLDDIKVTNVALLNVIPDKDVNGNFLPPLARKKVWV